MRLTAYLTVAKAFKKLRELHYHYTIAFSNAAIKIKLDLAYSTSQAKNEAHSLDAVSH